ncbi:hypothetical protein CLV40_104187 [Actinokineospora auranticolor]|uniref:Uncharacterized protein n=1 Tax=Actinokineospora auranticolor TaxID=155976 RepID=A0A2S6GUS2_9PSEU|nr:hypothetical protein CLV40_104187 [Actinokineospora auranticolor]
MEPWVTRQPAAADASGCGPTLREKAVVLDRANPLCAGPLRACGGAKAGGMASHPTRREAWQTRPPTQSKSARSGVWQGRVALASNVGSRSVCRWVARELAEGVGELRQRRDTWAGDAEQAADCGAGLERKPRQRREAQAETRHANRRHGTISRPQAGGKRTRGSENRHRQTRTTRTDDTGGAAGHRRVGRTCGRGGGGRSASPGPTVWDQAAGWWENSRRDSGRRAGPQSRYCAPRSTTVTSPS